MAVALLGGQVQLGDPLAPRPAERVVGRLELAHTTRRFLLQIAVDADTCRVLVGPADCGIDTDVPNDQPGSIRPGLQRR